MARDGGSFCLDFDRLFFRVHGTHAIFDARARTLTRVLGVPENAWMITPLGETTGPGPAQA